jgi:hypothetical protein
MTDARVAWSWKIHMVSALPQNELMALFVKAETNGLALDDLAATCEKFGIAPQDVLNQLRIGVAKGYLTGKFIYRFYDGVMNGIINAVVEVGMSDNMPQPAFSIYQAFDPGEWARRDYPPDTDPSEKYTKPAVQELVCSFRDSLSYVESFRLLQKSGMAPPFALR